MKNYVYLVTDIEADGPVPALHSMISLASVACDEDGEILGEFAENLLPLDGACPHPETMKFWATKPDVWQQCTTGTKAPELVMKEYAKWVQLWEGSYLCRSASFLRFHVG